MGTKTQDEKEGPTKRLYIRRQGHSIFGCLILSSGHPTFLKCVTFNEHHPSLAATQARAAATADRTHIQGEDWESLCL